MFVAIAFLSLALVAAVLARLFGAVRGAVVLVLLLVVGSLVVYKFVESGGAYLLLATMAIPIILVGGGIGLAAGSALKNKKHSGAKWLVAIPVGLLILSGAKEFLANQSELSAARYVRSIPEISAQLEGKANPFLVMTTDGPFGLPSRYEYALNKRYILLDASHMFVIPTFSLACITNVPPGQRSPFEDVCKREPDG